MVFYSCSNNFDKEIYNIVINSKIKPLPPPPPLSIGDTISTISKNVIDSLNKVPLKIAVNPFLLDFKGDYIKLFKNINDGRVNYSTSNVKVNKEDINGRESLKFTVLEEDVLDTTTIKKYDGILFLSSIKYNSKKNKALVIIGYTTGKLSSSTYLYLLENNADVWEITNIKRLSVS